MNSNTKIRAAMLVVALLLGLAAAIVATSATGKGSAIVLARSVAAGARIEGSDLRTVEVERSAIPPGTLIDAGDAIGSHARGPLIRGQYLLPDNLASGSAEGLAGGSLPTGMGLTLIAVPLKFEHALGGAMGPGQLVDLYAVPQRGNGPAEIIAPGARVVSLRNGRGETALAGEDGSRSELMESALLALPRELVEAVVTRVETHTFVLAAPILPDEASR